MASDGSLKQSGLVLLALTALFLISAQDVSAQTIVVNYTSDSSWTAPTGVTWAFVEAWAGGGAGGGRTSSGRAGGGGGGAYANKNFTVSGGQVHNITVAAAVTGGTGNGANGNPTYFNTGALLYAAGGSGGASAGTGGAGGTVAASAGDIRYAGGNGGTSDGTWSGGGGGGAGSTGAGGNANIGTAGTGTAELGGDGGAGINSNGNGNAGSVYGGGGGGARRGFFGSYSGGNGAAGFLRVSYFNDTIPPAWNETPESQTVEYTYPLYYDLNATDNYVLGDYAINDTANFKINSANGVMQNNTGLSIGVYWLDVSVNDTYGNINSTIINITVQDTTAPAWNETPESQTINLGNPFYYDANASDPSGTSQYFIDDSTNFTIDANTGIIQNATGLNKPLYWLNISVNDTYNNRLSEVINVTVNDVTKPEVSTILPTSANEDTATSYNATVSDIFGVISCNLYINGTLNGSMAITGNTANRTVTITTPGTYLFLANCTDATGNYNDTSATAITINDVTAPVWNETPESQTIEYGTPFYYDVNASNGGGIDSYWINDTANFKINPANGVIQNNTLLPVGVKWLNISVNDTSNNILSGIINITVQDTIPPIISNANATSISNTTATIVWGTDENANSTVNYANTTALGNYAAAAAYVTSHSIPLAGLEPNTTYYYNITSCDAYDNCKTSGVYNFTTTILIVDSMPPAWNETPESQTIEYGTAFYYDVNATDLNGISQYWINDTANFKINPANGVITNNTLLQVEKYWLNISVNDTYNNILSEVINVTVQDTTLPAITDVNATSITNETANIVWGTDENANSTVNYANTTALGNYAAAAAYVISHSIPLSSLERNMTYYYNVTSCDAYDNCKTSGVYNFTTLAAYLDSVPPNVFLNSPPGNAVDVDSNITFNCSATDDYRLRKIELYFDSVFNQSANVSGISNNSMFYLYNLADGSYSWSCAAHDTGGNNDTETRQLTVNASAAPAYNSVYFAGNTTDWSSVPDITNVCNGTAILDNPATDKIQWAGCVNAFNANFDTNVILGNNNVTVDFGLHPSFNSSATITMRNLPWDYTPVIYKDSQVCPGTVCTGINYNAGTGTLVFDVTHFTSYTTKGNSQLEIWDETDSGMPYAGLTRYPNETVKFFANYTRRADGAAITGAACVINFTDADSGMIYDNTKKLYIYERNFTTNGTYSWNVTCSKSGSQTLTINDTIYISPHAEAAEEEEKDEEEEERKTVTSKGGIADRGDDEEALIISTCLELNRKLYFYSHNVKYELIFIKSDEDKSGFIVGKSYVELKKGGFQKLDLDEDGMSDTRIDSTGPRDGKQCFKLYEIREKEEPKIKVVPEEEIPPAVEKPEPPKRLTPYAVWLLSAALLATILLFGYLYRKEIKKAAAEYKSARRRKVPHMKSRFTLKKMLRYRWVVVFIAVIFLIGLILRPVVTGFATAINLLVNSPESLLTIAEAMLIAVAIFIMVHYFNDFGKVSFGKDEVRIIRVSENFLFAKKAGKRMKNKFTRIFSDEKPPKMTKAEKITIPEKKTEEKEFEEIMRERVYNYPDYRKKIESRKGEKKAVAKKMSSKELKKKMLNELNEVYGK